MVHTSTPNFAHVFQIDQRCWTIIHTSGSFGLTQLSMFHFLLRHSIHQTQRFPCTKEMWYQMLSPIHQLKSNKLTSTALSFAAFCHYLSILELAMQATASFHYQPCQDSRISCATHFQSTHAFPPAEVLSHTFFYFSMYYT